MRNPYIGITGVATPFEAQAILDMTPPYVRRKIGIGVLVSEKKMLAGIPAPLYPHWGAVERIFMPDPRAFNTIHYIPLQQEPHGDEYQMYAGLMKMREIGGAYLDAIQIDADWPNERAIARFRSDYPCIAIILQIRKRMLDLYDEPHALVEVIKQRYEDLVDYYMVDRSMGEGKRLDIVEAERYLAALTSAFPTCGLVVAGGLYAEVLKTSVRHLAMKIPHLSMDAQTHLQNIYGHLDYGHVKKYLHEALQVFNEYP